MPDRDTLPLKAHYGGAGNVLGDPLTEEVQPQDEMTRQFVERAYELYDEFEQVVAIDHTRMVDNRAIYELRDPRAGANEPQLPTLLSTIQSKIADQMDNMPECVLAPEEPSMQEYAEDATDLTRWVFERNEIDALYQQLTEDFYVVGCALMQIHWDEDMDGGRGNIRLTRVPAESVTWDPNAKELQDCRAIFKTTHHPRGWYEEHYPDVGRYVRPDQYRDDYRPAQTTRDQSVMMLEMWWREYDAKTRRSHIHMAQMAGRVMLYDSRKEYPQGLYTHGRYPLAMTVYRGAVGTLAGRSCVEDYVELNRYANRNAKYIDWATRMGARPKLLVSKAADLENPDAIADADAQILYYQGVGDIRNLISWMPAPQVPTMAFNMQQWYIDAIKQDSGQNQFARGEGGMGVTAASAIQSLQEAGAKSSRMESQRLSAMYREACNQVLWLLSQFFDPARVVMITGKDDSPFVARQLLIGRAQLVPPGQVAPAYRVNLQIRRRNPLRIESENQLTLQMYQYSQQSQTPMTLEMLLQLLQIDGKDRISQKLRVLERERQLAAQALNVAQQASDEANASRAQLNDVRQRMIADAQSAIDAAPAPAPNQDTASVYG